jgi:hypothetical protein
MTYCLCEFDNIMDAVIEVEFDSDLVPEVYIVRENRVCITKLFSQSELDRLEEEERFRLKCEREDILADNAEFERAHP